MRSLKSLLFCIGRTMRALAWSAVLLMLIIFVFGLIFTDITAEWFSRPERPRDAEIEAFLAMRFGGLLRSMHTLYASITGGNCRLQESSDKQMRRLSRMRMMCIVFCIYIICKTYMYVYCVYSSENSSKALFAGFTWVEARDVFSNHISEFTGPDL